MSQPPITIGLDGITASGNVPTWIIQKATLTEPLTDDTTQTVDGATACQAPDPVEPEPEPVAP